MDKFDSLQGDIKSDDFGGSTDRTVLGVGLVTLDVVQYIHRFPGRNEKLVASDSYVGYGGPAANALATAVRLGVKGNLVSVLGDSEISEILRAQLKIDNIGILDASGLDRTDWHPPLSTVLVSIDTGERAVVSINGTTQPLVECPAEVLRDVSAVLVDGHYMKLCIAIAQEAHNVGIPVLLDGGANKSGMEELLANVDIAVCSHDFKFDGESDTLSGLKARGIRYGAITNGSNPIEYYSDSVKGEVSISSTVAVDTLGAGDVLHGALLAYIGKCGFQPREFGRYLTFASNVATLSTESRGTRGWNVEDVSWSPITHD